MSHNSAWYSFAHMKDFLKAVVIAGLFAVPFLTLYVENDYFFPFITGKNFWFRILVDISFAAWVILAFADAEGKNINMDSLDLALEEKAWKEFKGNEVDSIISVRNTYIII